MSNIRQFPNADAIEDEAALWVAKIYGQTYKKEQGIPEKTQAELERWMSQSPRHRETFFKTVGSWDAIGMLSELAEIMPLSEIHSRNSLSFRIRRSLRKVASLVRGWFGLGLSGAVAASLVLFWLSLTPNPEPIEYVTAMGVQASYDLSDGSKLSLNTNSKVVIDFNDDRRVVVLEHGEAHFDVAKASDWPFMVYAGDGVVLAVGTAFNVDNRGDYVDVVVSEGTVKVISGLTRDGEDPLTLQDNPVDLLKPENLRVDQGSGQREVLLNAGQGALYSETGLQKESMEATSFIQRLAWQEGALIFQGETLEEALAEVSRYTNKELVITDASIRGLSVGGRYRLDDIDDLTNSLALGIGVITRYSEDGSSILFSKN